MKQDGNGGVTVMMAVHKSKRFMRKVFTSDPELKKPKRRTQRELPRGSIMNLY